MHLPEAARDSNTKATENVVRILKAGTKYPLDEYGFEEHGRESKCYVPVSRGDQLAVKFTLKSGQLEFVDLLVDGILRWSSYNKLATLRHSRTIFEVCHCTQGRRKGKLQISEMVVKNRTNWAEIPQSSSSSAASSTVGTLEVRILRKIPAGEDQVQAVRGPTFEHHQDWSTAVTRNIQSVLEAPPTFDIGFPNPQNGGSALRKFIAEDISGYYEWASFKFQFRSAEDIEALSVPVPASISSASELLNKDNYGTGTGRSDDHDDIFETMYDIKPEPQGSEEVLPVIKCSSESLAQCGSCETLQDATSNIGKVEAATYAAAIDHESNEELQVVSPSKITTFKGKGVEKDGDFLNHATWDNGENSQDSIDNDDTMPPTQPSDFTLGPTWTLRGARKEKETEEPVLPGLGILKDIRSIEAFSGRRIELDDEVSQSSTSSQPAQGSAKVTKEHVGDSFFALRGDYEHNTTTGIDTIEHPPTKFKSPVKPLAKKHGVSYRKRPDKLKHMGKGNNDAVPLEQKVLPNTPVQDLCPQNNDSSTTSGLEIRLEDTADTQSISDNTNELHMSSPALTPPSAKWGDPIDFRVFPGYEQAPASVTGSAWIASREGQKAHRSHKRKHSEDDKLVEGHPFNDAWRPNKKRCPTESSEMDLCATEQTPTTCGVQQEVHEYPITFPLTSHASYAPLDTAASMSPGRNQQTRAQLLEEKRTALEQAIAEELEVSRELAQAQELDAEMRKLDEDLATVKQRIAAKKARLLEFRKE